MLLAAVAAIASAQSPKLDATSEFNALNLAPSGEELPQDAGSSKSLGGTSLRPELFYPSLRASSRPAPEAKKEPAPAEKIVVPVFPCPQGCGGAAREAKAAPPAKAPVKLDFESMVAQTLGAPLPVYAADYFKEPTQEFAPVDQVNVPNDFIVGPGDELQIRGWGAIDVDVRVVVDRAGSIAIPKVGTISVAGVRYAELEKHLRGAIERTFHNFELSVSLGQLHSIRVYVTGFARKPGTFVLSSLSTLVNALFLSGGPAANGNLRAIELRRGGALVKRFDLYDFLLDGDKRNDARLQPDDVIFVPPAAGMAAIAGLVNRPAIFHLRTKETLGDLLRYAGGTSTTASSQRLSIERVGADGQRKVIDLALSDATAQQPVQDGDLVLVTPISPRFSNAVTLKGHVAQPLRHEWTPGMKVSDLIPSQDALVAPGYWIARNEQTRLVDLLEAPTPTAIRPDFPDIDWDYAVIERVRADRLAADLLPFALGKAVLEHDPANDLALQPGDTVTVFARGDFRAPVDARRKFVRIEGEVQHAGVYPMGPGETLRDALAKAGGVTPLAYVYGTELVRESVRVQQEKRIGEAIDRLEQDYQRYLIQRSRNSVSTEEAFGVPAEAEAIKGLTQRLRAARPSGRVILELAPGARDPDALPPLRIEGDDTIYVPPIPETIEVVGAVYHEGSFLFRERKSIDDYVAEAGPIPTSDRGEVYVIRADGTLVRNGRGMRVLPGDTLVLPEKIDRVSAVRTLKDWTQVLYQFGLGAAGLSVLKNL